LEIVDIGTIFEGDRIRWQFPQVGDAERPVEDARVKKIVGWGHSKYYDSPFLDFFEVDDKGDFGVQRAIALPLITHHNGRRVDRTYWAGRLPELDLLRQPSSNGKRETVAQLVMPLNEEDALAQLKTSTRKGLDEMSDSHRAHIEKWEPHVEAMGAEHVWASANRFSGRNGEGPVYAAIKRGSKDYAIVDYNTETQKKAKVLEDGFESSKTVMEAFKEYRAKAKAERGDDKAKKTPAKKAAAGKKAAASGSKKTTMTKGKTTSSSKKGPVRLTKPKK
jgi:hypothetical protein